jgi:hypothetical protein
MKTYVYYTLAALALGIVSLAYLRPDMAVAAWGVLGLCFS